MQKHSKITAGVGAGALAIVAVLVVHRADPRARVPVAEVEQQVEQHRPTTAARLPMPPPRELRRTERPRPSVAAPDDSVQFLSPDEMPDDRGEPYRRQAVASAVHGWGRFVAETDLSADKQRRILKILADAQAMFAEWKSTTDDPSYKPHESIATRFALNREVNADIERQLKSILTPGELAVYRRYIYKAEFFLSGRPLATQ